MRFGIVEMLPAQSGGSLELFSGSQDLLPLLTTDQIIDLAAAWVEEKQVSVNPPTAGEEPNNLAWQRRRREIYNNAIEAVLRELEDCDAGIEPARR